MGVVVSEMSSDTAMATLRTTANSRKRRPTIPRKRRMGMKTAMSEVLMERTVNPISLAPFIAILLMGGIVGRLFREFAVVLSVAIAVSLLISHTTTPMM